MKLDDIGHKVHNVVDAITHPHGHGDEPGIIFITGNGLLGHRVASRLAKAGHTQIRVGTRDFNSASELGKQGIALVDFSWEREGTYQEALDGVKTVFCTTPHHEGWATHFPSFFKACRGAGVKHFVKISFYHALTATRAHVMKNFHVALPKESPFQHVPLITMHGDCDEQVIKSSIDYTILFASHLMSNPLVYQGKALRESGTFYGASSGKGVNYVSPNDVAEVAVKVLLSPKDHKRKGYTLTGPCPIHDAEVAALLEKDLGKPVTFVDQMPSDFAKEERGAGDPEWLVDDLVGLEKMKASGMEEMNTFLSKDVQKICGHPPESFEEYLLAKHNMSPKELH